MARDYLVSQLVGQNIDLSHSLLVEAASTQINMIKEGNSFGIMSELMLSTIPNELVRGSVYPKIEMDFSLVAHDFNELSTAAKEMARMILERTP